MRPDGPFFQGHPKCGIYIETAERSVYANGQVFGQTVASGTLTENDASPFVYDGKTPRPWTVEYARDGQKVGITIDLMTWKLQRRWTQHGDLGFPMLLSSVAQQNCTGRVEVANAVLECGKAAAYLYASPNRKLYVAGYHGPEPAPLTLTVPGDQVKIQSLTCGTVVWDEGKVAIEILKP